MAKRNNTGGNTQDIGEKPKKPKNIAQITLIVRDDGKIAGDFWVWEDDDLGRHKKWTVSGEDFFRFLFKTQPKNVQAIASCMNIQIVMAGLPEDMQGPWLTNRDGKLKVLTGDALVSVLKSRNPAGNGQGDKLADSSEKKAAEEAGLTKA